MLYGEEIAGTSQFPVNKMFTKRVADSLAKLLEGRVDYVPSCRASKDFPKVTEKFVEVPMSKQTKSKDFLTWLQKSSKQGWY